MTYAQIFAFVVFIVFFAVLIVSSIFADRGLRTTTIVPAPTCPVQTCPVCPVDGVMPTNGVPIQPVSQSQPTILVGNKVVSSTSGRYIVTFRPQATDAQKSATMTALERNGGVITFKYTTVLSGFAAQIPTDYLATISSDANVESVSKDSVVSIGDCSKGPC